MTSDDDGTGRSRAALALAIALVVAVIGYAIGSIISSLTGRPGLDLPTGGALLGGAIGALAAWLKTGHHDGSGPP